MNTPLALSVVGHTNTGKTSLMRTLLRDSSFGEIKNAASTTRHVERAAITDYSQTLLYLYDTPGLEDAGGVYEWLEQNTSARSDGIERLQYFLASPAASDEFNQEAKVIRQLLNSDMALYVIDAREPVLEKYRDELTILSWCARPVMPVFNFTSGQKLDNWTSMLARRNLHVHSSFDTVAFDFEGEIRLWHNLSTMLPNSSITDQLIAMREREWRRLEQQAYLEIAYFLLDIAACRREIIQGEDPAPMLQTMQAAVRQREYQLHQCLLQLYRFYQNQVESHQWALQISNQDPFDANALKDYSIRTGAGASAGALIGMSIDIATLGGSLGLGTAIGSVLGGIMPNMQSITGKLSGKQTLFIAAETLTLLSARALDLLSAIKKRGHAAQDIVTIQSNQAPWQSDKMPSELDKARRRPQWSSLNTENSELSRRESEKAAESLAQILDAVQNQSLILTSPDLFKNAFNHWRK